MTSAEGGPQGANGNVDTAAKLFDLHFNRIYDFCLRLLGTPEAAAEAAEEAFRNALAAPATVALAAASFDVRLFSAAIDALEPRLKLRHPSSIGSNPLFHQLDVERLGDPTRAPSAQETAGLIWETASRLDPADYVLLDLYFRQSFAEPDLAAILHTTPGSVKSRLTKLIKKIEPELAALIVGRRGSRNCDGMRRAMLGLPIAATRSQVKKAVDKHARSCPICTATRVGLTSPLLVFGAFSLVVASSTEMEGARERLMAAAALLPAIGLPVAVAAQRPPVAPPVATGGAMGGGAIGGGGPPAILAGFAGLWRSLGNINFSGSRALPILGGMLVLAIAIGIAIGSGVFGGSGGGDKATPTPTATRTVTSTPSPKATLTPTAEATATEEAATETPESVTPTAAAATATPQNTTATPTPEPPTSTPEATHTPQPTETPTP
jgi:DNA-directed RNA polymerase specialized sigma24 family protein